MTALAAGDRQDSRLAADEERMKEERKAKGKGQKAKGKGGEERFAFCPSASGG
jgi:hypothetical protein